MFCPYMLAQGTGHTGLISAYLIPIIIWLVTDILFLKRHSPAWDAVALGLLCGAQLLLTEELLFGTIITCVVVIVVYTLSDRRYQSMEWRSILRSFGIALFTFCCAAIPLLGYQVFGPGHFSGLVHNLNFYNIDLLNLILPSPGLRFTIDAASYFTAFGWAAQGVEMQGYVGPFLLVLIAVLAVKRWKDLYTRIAVVLLIVFLVLSLGPSLHVAGIDIEFWLPWRAIQSLPILNNILPSRLFLFGYFGINCRHGWDRLRDQELERVRERSWGRRHYLACLRGCHETRFRTTPRMYLRSSPVLPSMRFHQGLQSL